MAYIVTFETASLDPSKEMPNPHNPIAGSSVLSWLIEKCLKHPIHCTSPEAEDWGWYIDVTDGDARYLVGGVCFSSPKDDPSESHEWLVQIDKKRSLLDILLGRNKLNAADVMVARIRDAIRAEPDFEKVEGQLER